MIDLLISIIFPVVLFSFFIREYSVMQSQHYEIRKYFKYGLNKKLMLQVIGIITFVVTFFIGDLQILSLIVLPFLSLGFFLIRKRRKVKMTNRIKRLIWVYFLITYLCFLSPLNKSLLMIVLLCFFYVYFSLVHFVSCFIENFIMEFYVRDAKRIIQGVKIIGITGSYGKTSCKNIIYDMMSGVVNVSKTPKSIIIKLELLKV